MGRIGRGVAPQNRQAEQDERCGEQTEPEHQARDGSVGLLHPLVGGAGEEAADGEDQCEQRRPDGEANRLPGLPDARVDARSGLSGPRLLRPPAVGDLFLPDHLHTGVPRPHRRPSYYA